MHRRAESFDNRIGRLAEPAAPEFLALGGGRRIGIFFCLGGFGYVAITGDGDKNFYIAFGEAF